MFHLYTPRKSQKTKVFLIFSGVKDIEQWTEMCQWEYFFTLLGFVRMATLFFYRITCQNYMEAVDDVLLTRIKSRKFYLFFRSLVFGKTALISEIYE